MKDKTKFFVVALLLSLIFSLGAVAAQEDISFEQSNIDEEPIETVNEGKENENDVGTDESQGK